MGVATLAPAADRDAGLVVAAAVQATRTEMSVGVGLVLVFLFTSAALSVHAALTLPDSAHRFPLRRRVMPVAVAVTAIGVGTFFVVHAALVRDEPLPGPGDVARAGGGAALSNASVATSTTTLDVTADVAASCAVIAFTLVCGGVLFLVRKPLWIPSRSALRPAPVPETTAAVVSGDATAANYVDQSSTINPMPSSQVFAVAASAVTAQLGFEFALFVSLAGLRQQESEEGATNGNEFFGRATFDFLTDTTDGLATLATVIVVAVYVLTTVAVHTVILFRDHPRFLAAARSIAFRNTKVVQVQTLPTSLRRRRARKLPPSQRSPPPPTAAHRPSTTTTATTAASDDDGGAALAASDGLDGGPSIVLVGGRQGSIVFTAREQDEDHDHHHGHCGPDHSPAEEMGDGEGNNGNGEGHLGAAPRARARVTTATRWSTRRRASTRSATAAAPHRPLPHLPRPAHSPRGGHLRQRSRRGRSTCTRPPRLRPSTPRTAGTGLRPPRRHRAKSPTRLRSGPPPSSFATAMSAAARPSCFCSAP
jgi:hypothetical protein